MSTTRKIPPPDDVQYTLLGEMPSGAQPVRTICAVESGRRFVTGDARSIFLGTTPLETFLKQTGQVDAFTVARLLDEQDWRGFEQRYAVVGQTVRAGQ